MSCWGPGCRPGYRSLRGPGPALPGLRWEDQAGTSQLGWPPSPGSPAPHLRPGHRAGVWRKNLHEEAVSQGNMYIFISRQQVHTLQSGGRAEPRLWAPRSLTGRVRRGGFSSAGSWREVRGRFTYKRTHRAGRAPGSRRQAPLLAPSSRRLRSVRRSLHLQVTEAG